MPQARFSKASPRPPRAPTTILVRGKTTTQMPIIHMYTHHNTKSVSLVSAPIVICLCVHLLGARNRSRSVLELNLAPLHFRAQPSYAAAER